MTFARAQSPGAGGSSSAQQGQSTRCERALNDHLDYISFDPFAASDGSPLLLLERYMSDPSIPSLAPPPLPARRSASSVADDQLPPASPPPAPVKAQPPPLPGRKLPPALSGSSAGQRLDDKKKAAGTPEVEELNVLLRRFDKVSLPRPGFPLPPY